jgi:transcriptional regulator of acetoin/glycerol metabolism
LTLTAGSTHQPDNQGPARQRINAGPGQVAPSRARPRSPPTARSASITCPARSPTSSSRAASAARPPLLDEAERAEAEQLSALLRACNGNVAEVARRLDKDRTQVYRDMRRLGVGRNDD